MNNFNISYGGGYATLTTELSSDQEINYREVGLLNNNIGTETFIAPDVSKRKTGTILTYDVTKLIPIESIFKSVVNKENFVKIMISLCDKMKNNENALLKSSKIVLNTKYIYLDPFWDNDMRFLYFPVVGYDNTPMRKDFFINVAYTAVFCNNEPSDYVNKYLDFICRAKTIDFDSIKSFLLSIDDYKIPDEEIEYEDNVVEEIICGNCNKANPVTNKFCQFCGAEFIFDDEKEQPEIEEVVIEKPKLLCPECGTEYKEGNKFCVECGTRLLKPIPKPLETEKIPEVAVEEPNIEEQVIEPISGVEEQPEEVSEVAFEEPNIEEQVIEPISEIEEQPEEVSEIAVEEPNIEEQVIEPISEVEEQQEEISEIAVEEPNIEEQVIEPILEVEEQQEENSEAAVEEPNIEEQIIEPISEVEEQQEENSEVAVEETVVEEQVLCPNCNTVNNANNRSCINCGIKFMLEDEEQPKEQLMCPICNTLNDFDSRSCKNCGVEFILEDETEEKQAEPVKEQPPVCVRCGAVGNIGASFCMNCGSRLPKKQELEPDITMPTVPNYEEFKRGRGNTINRFSAGYKAGGKFKPYLLRVSTGEIIYFDRPVFMIGKDFRYADYIVRDNKAVSRTHAEFLVKDGEVFIRDLKSTNKTFVNGRAIAPEKPVRLDDGCTIRLANEEFEYYTH